MKLRKKEVNKILDNWKTSKVIDYRKVKLGLLNNEWWLLMIQKEVKLN